MKFTWFILMPVVGFSPVVLRYLRIQGNTNPFLKEVCRHTTGKIVSSFVPMGGPIEDILRDTVYECVENRTVLAEYVAKHLLLQCISHEINDGVHEVWKKITH
jgi:hypothetical protein